MSENNIGPKIYDAYIKNNKSYIIMEYFDDNLDIVFNEYNLSKKEKGNILKNVNELFYKMIYDNNLICFDIKNTNIVYNKKNKKVRLIDFDGYFCSKIVKSSNKDLYFIMIILLYIYMSSVYTKVDNNLLKCYNKMSLFKKRHKYSKKITNVLNTNKAVNTIYTYYFDDKI